MIIQNIKSVNQAPQVRTVPLPVHQHVLSTSMQRTSKFYSSIKLYNLWNIGYFLEANHCAGNYDTYLTNGYPEDIKNQPHLFQLFFI